MDEGGASSPSGLSERARSDPDIVSIVTASYRQALDVRDCTTLYLTFTEGVSGVGARSLSSNGATPERLHNAARRTDRASADRLRSFVSRYARKRTAYSSFAELFRLISELF